MKSKNLSDGHFHYSHAVLFTVFLQAQDLNRRISAMQDQLNASVHRYYQHKLELIEARIDRYYQNVDDAISELDASLD